MNLTNFVRSAVVLFWCTSTLAIDAPNDGGARAQMALMLRADAARYEKGDGVPRDEAFAAAMYCRAARAGDAESQLRLGLAYANARGVPRNDGWAVYMFKLAADHGIPQGVSNLNLMRDVAPETPDCMIPPAPPPSVVTMMKPPKTERELAAEQKAEKQRIENARREAIAWKARGGVRIGMTKDQVLASNWGRPSRVRKTTTAAGTTELWVYSDGNYLHFSNGVLTVIEN